MQNVDAQALNNLLQGLQEVTDLQRSISEGAPTVQRHDDVIASVICPHLQARPMEADVRKRLLGRYPKSSALPKSDRDENGLASKALGEDRRPSHPGASKEPNVADTCTPQCASIFMLNETT